MDIQTKPDDFGPAIDLTKRRDFIDTLDKTVRQVLQELNKRLHEEGVFEHSPFCWGGDRNQVPMTGNLFGDDPWPDFETYFKGRPRIICYPMRGGSEAYWVDLIAIYHAEEQKNPVLKISCHKAWSWQEAYEIAVLTQQLLDVTD